MSRDMAHRPLVEFPDGTFYRESRDPLGRHLVRMAFGYLLVGLIVLAAIVAPLAIGGLLINALGL